jgi:hypothetical protein
MNMGHCGFNSASAELPSLKYHSSFATHLTLRGPRIPLVEHISAKYRTLFL